MRKQWIETPLLLAALLLAWRLIEAPPARQEMLSWGSALVTICAGVLRYLWSRRRGLGTLLTRLLQGGHWVATLIGPLLANALAEVLTADWLMVLAATVGLSLWFLAAGGPDESLRRENGL